MVQPLVLIDPDDPSDGPVIDITVGWLDEDHSFQNGYPQDERPYGLAIGELKVALTKLEALQIIEQLHLMMIEERDG